MSTAGPSGGFIALTDIFVCTSCKVVQDLKIGERQRPTIAMRPEPKSQEPVYRECGKGDNLIKWDVVKKPCPNCSGKMVKNDRVFGMWD